MTLALLFNQQEEQTQKGRAGFVPIFTPLQKTQRRLVFHKAYPIFVASRLKERKSIVVHVTKRLLVHGSIAVHVESKYHVNKSIRSHPLLKIYQLSKVVNILRVYDAFEESEKNKNGIPNN